MIFENILVAYDGSDHARRAFKLAAQFADESPETTLYLLNVIPKQPKENPHGASEVIEDYNALDTLIDFNNMDEELERSYQAVKQSMLDSLGLDTSTIEKRIYVDTIASSTIAHGICSYAEQRSCDAIIMGSRGCGTVRRALGSVSSQVLHESSVPVITVK